MQILYFSKKLTFSKIHKFSLVFFLGILSLNPLQGQVKTITIGIDGLTCPLCSRGVEMALRKLKFIESIQMDLEKTNAIISVKQDAPLSLNAIHKKVDESGFTLRFCSVQIKNGEGVQINANCIQTADFIFELSDEIKISSGDDLNLKLTAPKFNNIKESKEVKQEMSGNETTCTLNSVKEFFRVKLL